MDSGTTHLLPWPIFPKFVTRRRVLGNLVSSVTTGLRRYRKGDIEKFMGEKLFCSDLELCNLAQMWTKFESLISREIW